MKSSEEIVALELRCISGLISRFKAVLNDLLEDRVYLVTANDKVQASTRQSIPKYPVAFVTVNSFGRDTTSYNSLSLRREGIVVHRSETEIYKLRIMPTVFTVEVEYRTLRYDNASEVVKRLTMLREGALNFKYLVGMAELSVHVELPESIPLPLRETITESEPTYKVTCEVTMHGYSSITEVKKISPIVALDIGGIQYEYDPVTGNVKGGDFTPFTDM